MLNVPMDDPRRTYRKFAEEITSAILSTVESGVWLNGPKVAAFAQAFSRYLGVEFCLPVGNGTDALELALRALQLTGRMAGREVVTIANAGGYTASACWHVGLVPVFVDIVEDTQLVDIISVVAALGPATAAVVATHLYGGVVDVPALRKAMDAAGFSSVPIVEDCAQAHGARLSGHPVGAMGDVAAFSFYPTKNLGAIGDAGAVVTPHSDLYAVLRQLHQYGWSEKYKVALAGGRNSRMDEIQAAVLSVLLPQLDGLNRRRREILDVYSSASDDVKFVVGATPEAVVHLAVARCTERDRFREHMGMNRIATNVHYPILDCHQAGWTSLPQRLVRGGIPVSRRSVDQIVTVPCFPLMTQIEVERVFDGIRTWRNK